MKSQIIFYVFGSIVLFLISCTSQKHKHDFFVLELNTYYYSQISDIEQLFVEFHMIDTIISGGYFIYDGKALTEYIPFSIHRKKTHLIVNTENKTFKLKARILENGSGFNLVFQKRRLLSIFPKKQSIIFKKEDTIPEYRFTNRYKDVVFQRVREQVITYGRAKGFYVSKRVERMKEQDYAGIILTVAKNLVKSILPKEHQLEMDIYMPVGDTLGKRPILILVHGGAFIIGDKKSDTMEAIGQFFAQRGFVVASINYRLGYMFLPGSYHLLERSIYRAIQDTRAALRFIVHFSNQYRIDVNNIFLAGNSAGGFIAMKTAFMKEHSIFPSAKGVPLMLQEDLGCLDCSGNQYQHSFSLKGVINMWGGLTDISIIEPTDKIPILLIHGNADPIIPYDYDYPFANISTEISSFFSRKIYGSNAIFQQMNSLKLPSKLITLENAGHDPQLNHEGQLNNLMPIINEYIQSFIVNIMLQDHQIEIKGKTEFEKNDRVAMYAIKCKKHCLVNWNIRGGKIIEYSKDRKSVKVVWFANLTEKYISASVQNNIGLLNNEQKDMHF
jgi:pimeloyl-ACP methyl ester carboxylesterase